jgi:hypothetical protein
LKLPTLSSILFLSSVLPSNPSHIGITLLIFLEGDNWKEFRSETLDALLGTGLGSFSGSVGRGAEEKYLKWKRRDWNHRKRQEIIHHSFSRMFNAIPVF